MTVRRLALIGLFIIAAAAVTGKYAEYFLQPAQAGWFGGSSKSLMVFAGTASQPALDEAAAAYKKKTGIKIDISYAGSGTLLTQITQEHVGDLYIPGSDDYATKAIKKGAIDPPSVRALAYLIPAILVAKNNPKGVTGLNSLAQAGLRVVIAKAGAACLGDVAEDILAKAGLTAKVHKNVVSYATTCEETLNDLLMGEADAIIGWDVYARQHPKQVKLIPIDKKLARPRYIPAAVITWSKNKTAAAAFLAYLTGPSGRYCFKTNGYTLTAK
jgi:molybdate transport system substrate-binding protein